MESNYHGSCGQPSFYGSERGSGEQRVSRHHLPLQRPHQLHHRQHVAHYRHQGPYQHSLLPTPQPPGYVVPVVEQPESVCERADFSSARGGPAVPRSIFADAGAALPTPNVLVQPTSQSQPNFSLMNPELTPLRPGSGPVSFAPTSTAQQPLQESPKGVADTQGLNQQSLTQGQSGQAEPSARNEPAIPALAAMSEETQLQAPPPVLAAGACSTPEKQLPAGSCTSPAKKPPAGVNSSPGKQPPTGACSSHVKQPPRGVLMERQLNAYYRPRRLTKKNAVKDPMPCRELPPYLLYKSDPSAKESIAGVIAREEVEAGAEFGPFEGTLMDEELGAPLATTWELCLRGKVFFYIDGKRKDQQNWMSHMRCARQAEEQNVEAFQYYGEVYFRTTRVIEPGSELRVFYSDEFARRVGFRTKLQELNWNKDASDFQCSLCETHFPSAKHMMRHVKMDHDANRINEMLPVVSWKMKSKKLPENHPNPKEGVSKAAGDSVESGQEAVPAMKSEDFACPTCRKTFPTEGRLKAHELFHEYSEEHACPICGERQLNAHTLAKHMAHHDVRPHKCDQCGKSYKSKPALYRHDRDVHGAPAAKGYRCRCCPLEFAKKAECNKHEKTHKGPNSTTDQTGNTACPKRRRYQIKTRIPLRFDAEKEDKKLKESIKETEGDSTTGDKMPSRNAKGNAQTDELKDMLGKAIDYYSKPRPYKCRYCPKRYCHRKMAFEHEQEVHVGKGVHKCTNCPRVFMNENRFLDHTKCHEENRMYRCTLCPRTFASESAFNNHQGEHTGLKPFKCDLCGRGFRIRKAVYEHKRRMHQDRPPRFFCGICNKGFLEKGALVKHERRHRGIRPFVCLTCGKGFTEKCALVAHVQCMHTDKKPFSCQICRKTFSLNQNYTYHMFKHKSQGEDLVSGDSAAQEQQQ